MAQEYSLFEGKCEGCGKVIPAYGVDRQGTPAKVTCGRVCDTQAYIAKKYINKKTMVEIKQGIDTAQLNKRMAEKSWNNKQYLVEDIPV